MFFSDNVKEILKILGAEGRDFISIEEANFAKKILEYKNSLIRLLEEADDEEFISGFEDDKKFIFQITGAWVDFSLSLKEKINWLTEFNLLFSFLDDKPELAGQVSEKLEPLLKHFGYKQIYPKKGEEYDPREHKVEGEEPSIMKRGQIARVARRGIKKGGKVLVKANVIIAK